MYKVISTYTGPEDKLEINGVFYRLTFMNIPALTAFVENSAGFILANPVIPTPGVRTKEYFFDTQENAQSWADARNNGPVVELTYTDRAAMLAYENTHGITRTFQVLPAV